MILRTLKPETVKKALMFYRMRLEGKSNVQIERETGTHFTNVSAYVNYIKRHPELIQEEEGGEA